jgi:glycosyltransferase involved in cell wall biosynthesis
LGERFVVGYIGTHGMAHSLETVLKVAVRIQREGFERVCFLFLGDGAAKRDLMARAERTGIKNVKFIDSVPKSEVTRYWSLLDVSLIHLKKDPLFTTVIPSKLFESLAMGIPVLHGVAGESADIVRNEKVGVVFEPENVGELCEGVRKLSRDHQLYKELQSRCAAAAKKYERSVLAKSMLDVFDALLNQRTRIPSQEPEG